MVAIPISCQFSAMKFKVLLLAFSFSVIHADPGVEILHGKLPKVKLTELLKFNHKLNNNLKRNFFRMPYPIFKGRSNNLIENLNIRY